MPSKFGETLKFILQVGRHLEKFRRIIGVKKNKEKCSKKIMKSVSKTLKHLLLVNLEKILRKIGGKKNKGKRQWSFGI